MDFDKLVPISNTNINKRLHLVRSDPGVDREAAIDSIIGTPNETNAETCPETGKQGNEPAQPDAEKPPSTPARPETEKHPATPSRPEINKRLSATSSIICRICHQGSIHSNSFVNPCNCKGTAGFVHPSCLQRWIAMSGRSQCEICLYQFPVIKTRRLGLCEGIRRWLLLPGRLRDFISDGLMAILLTSATGALVAICLLGAEYFANEGYKVGVNRQWTRGAVGFFVGILLFGYVVTICLLTRDIVGPWWTWWRSGVDVVQVVGDEVDVSHERALGMDV
ncbi:E3 ubiquitin-protein ligase MARCHF1 [Ischnura elegans]|uniref:E3 ubiquitin-protein ligase MARCHF1 n=1 Tax=Ischnura elegans TaxID=197161 RepID=UPI001ED8AC6F|nr:E3 ubiquitin-protein ligase MARCHF1 [Ischnura elegans]